MRYEETANQGTLVARPLWRVGTRGVAKVKDHTKHDEDLDEGTCESRFGKGGMKFSCGQEGGA